MNTSTKPTRLLRHFRMLIVFSLLASHVYGQESKTTEYEEENEKKFRIAIALGQGYISQASNSERNFVIIPTVGLDIQYWFSERWGIGIKSDIEISNYVVEHDGEEGEIERETPIIISMPLFIKPFDNELAFIVGPGIELEKSENFSILRLGIGYEFEIGRFWDFSPEVVYDLKNANINSLTIAFGVGRKF